VLQVERAPTAAILKGGTDLISSDVIRGYNDTIILFLLLDGPSYGYEISKNIRELSDDKYIMKETTLYSAFNRLESNGYIESFYGDESFGKRRTYYKITPTGLSYYKEKCEEWELTKDVINRFIKEWNV
jgi:DNA-binding PadR family transcriptional regulator